VAPSGAVFVCTDKKEKMVAKPGKNRQERFFTNPLFRVSPKGEAHGRAE